METDKSLEIWELVELSYKRIHQHIRKTPLEYSPVLCQNTKGKVYLKLESEQLTGSFKVRGAFNKILYCESQNKSSSAEYVTASSGNHGVACGLVLKKLGLKSKVYTSTLLQPGKEDILKLYDVDIIKHGNDCVEAEMEARFGWVYISPYSDYQILSGQGTIGVEILEDLPEVDAVFITVGGGGLISGIGSYLKHKKPSIEIVGCSPINSNCMEQSIKAGKIIDIESLDTLSDGSAGGIEKDSVTFPICQKVVDKWISVTEDEIAEAIFFMLKNHHKVIEGAAGVALASFVKTCGDYENKSVVIVQCGANIGMDKLKIIINKYCHL